MYEVVYTPKALNELEECIQWYGERSISAAERFIEAVKVGIDNIRREPLRHKNKYRDFFEIKVNKFPYDIIYIIENERVVIISIYHQKRDPRKKYK